MRNAMHPQKNNTEHHRGKWISHVAKPIVRQIGNFVELARTVRASFSFLAAPRPRRIRQAATALLRRRDATPIMPKPMINIAQTSGSGVFDPDPPPRTEEKVKLPEIEGCGLPGRSAPVCVKPTVRLASPVVKPLSAPVGVKLPIASKFTFAFGAETVAKLLSVPEKLPKLLVKLTIMPFVATTGANVSNVPIGMTETSPVVLVTNPPRFESVEPAPMPNVDEVTPANAAEKVPLTVTAPALAANAMLAAAATRKNDVFILKSLPAHS